MTTHPLEPDKLVPAILSLVTADARWDQIREQYRRLSDCEKVRLHKLLKNAERLDRQLGEIRLILPVLQIQFLGLPSTTLPLTLHPEELRRLIKRWLVQDHRDRH